MLNLRVCKDWRATRLDRFLMFHFPGVPFNLIAQLVKKRAIRLKSKPSHINSLLEEGDQIVINSGFLKDHLRQTPTQIDIGQSRALVEKMLVYEDEHFAVLNKPHGISCQSGGFNKTQEMKNATNIADMVKPLGWRIPHRLDSGASGALILCKTHQAASLLSKVFKEHTLRMEHNAFKKTYLAVLNGIPKDQHGQFVYFML
jgi:23S rRNA pseudouridine955/2504/2580 synthase